MKEFKKNLAKAFGKKNLSESFDDLTLVINSDDLVEVCTQLRDDFNRELAIFKQSGKYAEIERKYIGDVFVVGN